MTLSSANETKKRSHQNRYLIFLIVSVSTLTIIFTLRVKKKRISYNYKYIEKKMIN